jgi:chorismate-pyruvate lyase
MFAAVSFEPTTTGQSPALSSLLERFYVRTGLPLPRLEVLKENEVVEPYKRLLVHSSDMTPTLEAFYKESLGLTVLSRELQRDSYLREVVLTIGEARPVEYGVIRICLDRFPPNVRRRVLDEQRPLGHILQTEGLPHLSWPQAFFRVRSDAHMRAVLRLREPGMLYGRRNVILDGSRRLLAEVLEILAPAPTEASSTA